MGVGYGRGKARTATYSQEERVTLLIIFTIGYAIGGVSALALLGLTLAGREHGARKELAP